MKIICAWCNAILQCGTLPASHGICPECLSTQLDIAVAR